MIYKINWLNRLYKQIATHPSDRNIRGNKTQLVENITDSFEKCKSEIKQFTITHLEYQNKSPKLVKVKQNSLDSAVLYKKEKNKSTGKTEKIPIKIGIAISEKDWTTTYHFIEAETNNEIGFVTICDWKKAKNYKIAAYITEGKLLDDFPEQGIVGERISIDYLQNNLPDKYAGIGRAGDQLAIEYCLNHGITPNIVSLADLNSHAAHYKRGRRFFNIDKNNIDIDYYDFKRRFNTTNPNKIIETRIKATPEGQDVECSDLGLLYMYMPKAIVKAYIEKIKENPYLH